MYLVTGGTGFVGGAILNRLIENGETVVATVRRKPRDLTSQYASVEVGDLGQKPDWTLALVGIKIVVHTAARVHVMNDQDEDPLSEFRRINVAGTLHLATQAARAGVQRFIFLSSIKVNGEQTIKGQPFTSNDTPKPTDPYGISKLEAEEGLRQIALQTGMEVVIIRPVLVYGPGVKGNFLSMMRWLYKGIPLPFSAINNSRSFVALDNLIDLIITCTRHPAATNQTFLVSDGEDLSTSDLLKRMSYAMNKKPLLFFMPKLCLRFGAFLLGKSTLSQRLIESLQVDINKTKILLGWKPIVSVDEALLKTAKAFLDNKFKLDF